MIIYFVLTESDGLVIIFGIYCAGNGIYRLIRSIKMSEIILYILYLQVGPRKPLVLSAKLKLTLFGSTNNQLK